MNQQKKNPVQIVLNASNYVSFQDSPPGGGAKDFFGDNDAAFVEHKHKLQEQLGSIQAILDQSGAEKVAYVKVKMRKEALAKSHRPVGAIFKPDECPLVGVDGIGELYYRVSPRTIGMVKNSISRAEDSTRKKTNPRTEKVEYNPSRNRSEVGAIQDILLPDEADKRSFSVAQGVKWLENERSGRIYIVSLFHLPQTMGEYLKYPKSEASSFEDLINKLNSLKCGIQIFRSSIASGGAHAFLLVRPIKKKLKLQLEDIFAYWDNKMELEDFDGSTESHHSLITVLSNHRIVRKITLPPLIESAQRESQDLPGARVFPRRDSQRRYPKVGIVDGGIDPGLADWTLGSSGVIATEHRNEAHGSFIAGLLVAARASGNQHSVAKEEDGCEIYDLDIFPNSHVAGAFKSYYPKGFEDFFQELELAVAQAKKDHGVRVFNISLNIIQQVDEGQYGPAAIMLDEIAEKHDVILVISAGNMQSGSLRGPWPDLPSKVAGYLLPFASTDRLYQPSESVYSITVSAINPPGVPGHLVDAPASYTRRGPGMKVGLKPDFCHYGGVASRPGVDNGLYSMRSNGDVIFGCGTSYAAPLVAKTLASVDNIIDGHVARETLIALLIHSASRPAPLDHKELNTIAKNFVGFGLPSSSEEILLTDDNSITMIFHSSLNAKKQLVFDFAWPQALVSGMGKCRGEARMTLVYKPIINAACGAEFIRVNLDAFLRQSDGKGGFKGRAQQIYMKEDAKDVHFEADLIEQGLKWWPSKHYRMKPTEGLGKSSNWRLVVEPLVRDSTIFPQTGVPFSVILTIGDHGGKEPIFNDMKLWLGANSVKINDIQTAARIRP